jgi:2-keto-4-pentenoate hydratase/2-oxohepta-3-ene-1,7-dioic acid hydratase in catechol pathway
VRIARFTAGAEPSFGVVEGEGEDAVLAAIDGHPATSFAYTGVRYPLAEVRLLAPVIPTKVVAIGKNYADHVAEMGGSAPPSEPLVFLKPSTAVIGPGDGIGYPRQSSRVDFEGELAVVIKALCREVPAAKASEVVLGYTCANDVTARDLQEKDGQWTRAKGFDGFCPLGPWIDTEVAPDDLAITTTLNGELKQAGRTSQLVHDVPRLIEYVSSVMTLVPGDVILTGTPAGIGPMDVGDEVTVSIEGIGALTNTVVRRG